MGKFFGRNQARRPQQVIRGTKKATRRAGTTCGRPVKRTPRKPGR